MYQSQANSILYILYNDEKSPESDKSSRNGGGHTKGVVAFDGTAGFWLIHSVPKFPPPQKEQYDYPSSALNYGQTFLCVSFSYNQLGKIGQQLQFNQPDIYDFFIPDAAAKDFPVLVDLVNGKRPHGPPWYSVAQLTSLAGQDFVSFAKANKYGADLYDSLVAPTLRDNLLVETWLRESGTELSSNCTAEYKVLRVNQVQLPENVLFEETKDHAKWAISDGKGQGKWTCIGDINRMVSQFHRGGGTLCLNNNAVWEAFARSVANYTGCNSSRKMFFSQAFYKKLFGNMVEKMSMH